MGVAEREISTGKAQAVQRRRNQRYKAMGAVQSSEVLGRWSATNENAEIVNAAGGKFVVQLSLIVNVIPGMR